MIIFLISEFGDIKILPFVNLDEYSIQNKESYQSAVSRHLQRDLITPETRNKSTVTPSLTHFKRNSKELEVCFT